jgi:pseudouridine-5'-phosphate glycosidase
VRSLARSADSPGEPPGARSHLPGARAYSRAMPSSDRLVVAPEVGDALRAARPVVALESTLISHGLPHPQNVEVALAAEASVRRSGAVPATIAMRDGRLLVGLAADELEALATAPPGSVRKVSRHSLAEGAAAGGWSATTVSATMIVAHAVGIRVFSTGGIGGVHRGALDGAHPTFDISADLEELARTPVAVVCAGPKAILDVPRTLEYLETRGVPVLVLGSDEVPFFWARRSGIPAPLTVADPAAAARVVEAQAALGLDAGIVVCNPVPEADALSEDLVREVVSRALADAEAAGVHGPATTPWLLARVAEITAGASVKANTALIVDNARVGGLLAAELAAGRASELARESAAS